MHTLSIRRVLVALAFAVSPALANHAFADQMNILSSSVPTLNLQPSSDSISLNAGSATFDPMSGAPFLVQTGNFILGDSEIPDQIINFTLHDTITLNGITQIVSIFGQDNVTNASDTLTIFAGAPIIIGHEIFTVQAFTASGFNIGQNVPIQIEAVVTPVPEPGSFLLLGTGLVCGAVLIAATTRSTNPGSMS